MVTAGGAGSRAKARVVSGRSPKGPAAVPFLEVDEGTVGELSLQGVMVLGSWWRRVVCAGCFGSWWVGGIVSGRDFWAAGVMVATGIALLVRRAYPVW